MAYSSPGLNGIVIGLLSSFGSAILILLIFLAFYFFRYTASGRIFLDRIGRPGEYDDEQAFAREEAEALETMDDIQRTEYLRAKAFIAANPPESVQTDISLSQYLAIQEKGVSAWEFEPELEIANCFVQARTEIEFFDSECTVMCNLPVPKQNDIYYWEVKIFDKPENTLLSIGMATKPYPLFRLPGFHKCSVAYLSDGTRRYNQPFFGTLYGPQMVQGDVIGVGYRPRTGTIFFTRNGKKLEDVVHGLKSQNFFPSIGANGPCIVHVNLGQAGYVHLEANVKKWGLAPMTGSLAPPPPYGVETDTVLLATGTKDGFTSSQPGRGHQYSSSAQLYRQGPNNNNNAPGSGHGHGRSRSGNFRVLPPISPGPPRSPTDISLAHLVPTDDDDAGEPSSSSVALVQQHQQQSSGQDYIHYQPHPPSSTTAPTAAAAAAGGGVGLGLHDDADNRPPPEYTSPQHSDAESDEEQGSSSSSGSSSNRPRNSASEDSDENAPLIRLTRSRGASASTGTGAGTGAGAGAGGRTGGGGGGRGVRRQSQGAGGGGGRRGGRGPPSPPIPTYQDAIRQGAGQGQQRQSSEGRRGQQGQGQGQGQERRQLGRERSWSAR